MVRALASAVPTLGGPRNALAIKADRANGGNDEVRGVAFGTFASRKWDAAGPVLQVRGPRRHSPRDERLAARLRVFASRGGRVHLAFLRAQGKQAGSRLRTSRLLAYGTAMRLECVWFTGALREGASSKAALERSHSRRLATPLPLGSRRHQAGSPTWRACQGGDVRIRRQRCQVTRRPS